MAARCRADIQPGNTCARGGRRGRAARCASARSGRPVRGVADRAARTPRHLPDRRQRPAGGADPRDAQLLEPLAVGGAEPRRATTRSIAPDLIGHGDSAAPRGDYSLGAHAASIRDLLAAIGVERASIVGHSLGGGVAMQFFYQFPQRVERLVLISSGGLGHEVSPMLRTRGAARRLGAAVADDPSAPAGGARARPAAACASAALGGGVLPAGDRARAAPAGERRRAPGVPAHAALGDRRARPARQRHRPPVPAGDDADADRVGRARQHDPDRARPPRPRGDPATAASGRCPTRRTSPTWKTPTGSLGAAARVHRSRPQPGRIEDADWGAVLARRSPRSRRLGNAAA